VTFDFVLLFQNMATIFIKRRCCKTNIYLFCYICREYVIVKQQNIITYFVKKIYREYFGIQFGIQEKSWASNIACNSCIENLRNWKQGKRLLCYFGYLWLDVNQKIHIDDCYYCMVHVSGYIKRNKSKLIYSNLLSGIRLIP